MSKYYITRGGRPLCTREEWRRLSSGAWVECGHNTLESAGDAMARLKKDLPNMTFRIEPGECPNLTGLTPEDDMLDLRLALNPSGMTAEMLTTGLRAALHVAGEMDGPAGRLAGNELLRLIGDAATLERKIAELREAVGR